mmetsp:Transcript_8415/g.12719  ORF Transcript_8415/g.12719 Transcript_8415/m.12719 type:complete len:88 (-) Transcript_8415:228-491(-)|eukprot:CAMPEP_0171474470 /NCGR_PEP_ID=MMETSP0946-20130122/2443_1 /TAXON_ID=109269 /ORGANISM="Vaucheria litorea, Strain CCMP2940" /LENGTH=87 /DNA_ID=CAMNT_0012004405 /DNA_START=235 /DNA_END=498 /DNA_ORIENTATION=-
MNRNPIIPENIADQIILWEEERGRVIYTKGVLLDVQYFSGSSEFDKAVQFAEDLGGCLWYSRDKRAIVVESKILSQIHKKMESLSAV